MSDVEARLLAMWVKGVKLDVMSSELGGMSPSAINRRLRALGVPARSSGNRPVYVVKGRVGFGSRNLWPMVLQWVRSGHSPEFIAEGIGLSGRARDIMAGLDDNRGR